MPGRRPFAEAPARALRPGDPMNNFVTLMASTDYAPALFLLLLIATTAGGSD
jgi:hypothetical protein